MYFFAANSTAYQPGTLLTNLSAGLNIIHIKDSHGCTTDTSITLTQPPALAFTGLDITNPTCEGYKDGAVTLHAAGGAPLYYYSADNTTYFVTPGFSSLHEGTYTFYITDSHHCFADTTVTLVGYPHILMGQVNVSEPTCTGSADGVIAVIPAGGINPLSVKINDNHGEPVPGVYNNLASGSYTVTVTDSAHCSKDTVIALINPDSFHVFTAVTPNNCVGNDNNGTVSVTITGGNPPYTYLWSNGAANDSVMTARANGNYTVWVKDRNNCRDSATAFIGYDDCCIPVVPNAFSPNGDGKNDIFRLRYKGDIRIIEFSVWNRYGERVFITEYSEDGWDGTYKGQPADMDNYYYYVRLLCGNLHNNIMEFKGAVTLVR